MIYDDQDWATSDVVDMPPLTRAEKLTLYAYAYAYDDGELRLLWYRTKFEGWPATQAEWMRLKHPPRAARRRCGR